MKEFADPAQVKVSKENLIAFANKYQVIIQCFSL